MTEVCPVGTFHPPSYSDPSSGVAVGDLSQALVSFVFLGHLEIPRLGVKSELQLLACATATATPDLSCICDLHHSSWQHQILSTLTEARDQTLILMDTSQVCFH